MNAKTLLLAHGEKILVLVTAVLCGLGIYSTITDDSVRPAGITAAAIREKNDAIDKAMKEAAAPQLLPVPGYLDNMKRRFDSQFPTNGQMPWLSAMPDRGPGEGTILYVYELPAPIVAARDVAGVVELTINAAPAIRPANRRVADLNAVEWTSPTGGVSSAAHLGFQIETRIAGQAWKPLKSKQVDNGLVALDATGHVSLKLEGLEPWDTHEFRASLIAKATGFPLDSDGRKEGAGTVLVTAGRVVPGQDIDSIPWENWLSSLESKDAEITKRFLVPTRILPPGTTLAAGESAYQGAFTDQDKVASVQVTSDVRFALDKISEQEGQPIAHILVTRQLKAPAGNVWLNEPVAFKVAIGESVGKKVDVIDPRDAAGKRKFPCDLSTPFEVLDVKRDVRRIFYHEIREVTRQGGVKGKDLMVVTKDGRTDMVILRNAKTGITTELVKLGSLRRPTKEGAVFDPWFPADIQEEEEFKKNPATFRMALLEPPAPKAWAKDEGPLAKLREEQPEVDQDAFTTDTGYFEFADGRVAWWEPLNKRLHVFPEQIAVAADPVAPGIPPVMPPLPSNEPPTGTKPPRGVMLPAAIPPVVPPPGAR